MPSVRKNFFYNSAYQILLVIAPIITTPFLARVIGADGNGLYSYTQAITNYFVMAAVLGMSNYGVRLIAEAGDDRYQRTKSFWNAFTVNSLFGALSIIAYIIMAVTVGRTHWQLWLCWSLWIIGAICDVSWLFFGVQQFRTPTIRNFVTKVTSIVAILLFVRDANDVWIYVLATSGAAFGNSILLWPFVRRYIDWHRPTWHDMKKHVKPNLVLFVPVAATSLYTVLDKILLGTIAGLTQTGFYDYSEKITKIPLSVVTALGVVMLPRMSTLISSGKTKEGKRLIGLSLWTMVGAALAMMFGICAIASEFVPVFLGTGYGETTVLILFLAPIIPLISATNVLGIQYLLPRHRDRIFTCTLVFGALVNIVANLLLIPRLGAVGTAIATLLTEFAVLGAQAIAVKNELPIGKYAADTVPFLVIGILMLLLVRGVAYLSSLANLILPACLLLEVLAGAAFFIPVAGFWFLHTKNEHFRDAFPLIVRRFERRN